MKEIIYIIYSLSSVGGTERVTANIANALSLDEEFKVYIISLHGKGSFFQFNDNISIFYLESTGKENNLLSTARLAINVINKLRPDVVVGVSVNKLNLFLAIISFFFKRRSRLIASEHIAFSNSGRFIQFVKKILYKRFDVISVLTEHDRKLLIDEGFLNIVKIPNASTYFSDEVVPVVERKRQIISIGRFTIQKGFDRLIEAWSKLFEDYPDWRLKIVGEGEEEENLRKLATKYNMTSRSCVFSSFTNDVGNELMESQIYIMTSRFEGLPMVLIEALCSGCPLISYDCETGPREIIKDSYTGFLIEDNNLIKLVQQLDLLIKEERLRELFSLNAIRDRSRFSSDVILKQWKDVF